MEEDLKMKMRKDIELMTVGDAVILSGFKTLCKNERELQSNFLAYLNEVEIRKLFAGEGYSSLCGFLIKHLNYSESTALKRIQVARTARRFPLIYYLLADAKVSLSSVERVAPHLNESNSERILNSIIHKSVREVEVLLAAEFPKPEPKDRVNPLSEDKYLVQLTVGKEFIENLEEAKALLCREFPKGRASEILGKALKLLLEESEMQRDGKSSSYDKVSKSKEADDGAADAGASADAVNPQTVEKPLQEYTSRYIPRGIRREVWKRDKGCCQFKSPNGELCGERKFLEFDHVLPWALGGSSHSVDNVRILCRVHNEWTARKYFRNWVMGVAGQQMENGVGNGL